MSHSKLQGEAECIHRARLFPLPLVEESAGASPSRSARARGRIAQRRFALDATNACITALNQLYSPTVAGNSIRVTSVHHPSSSNSHGGNRPLFNLPTLARSPSKAQVRLQNYLRRICSDFAARARIGHIPFTIGSDIAAEDRPSGVLTSDEGEPQPARTTSKHFPSFPAGASDLAGSYTDPASVVPLVASRVSLPERLHLIDLADVLPPSVAATYSHEESPQLMRDPLEYRLRHAQSPPTRPRIHGARSEYVKLIGRLASLGMVAFTRHPKAINGVFTVRKDADTDRLIINAIPANQFFVDSPPVDLPNASHMLQVRVTVGARLNVGKSDLSNFYHHLRLPAWMRPYFALPCLTREEMTGLGLPCEGELVYPMCVSLPMGFSHAVYLAQLCHEHVLYRSGVIDSADSLFQSAGQLLCGARVLHGIYIDDFFCLGIDRQASERLLARVLDAYRSAGFVVKDSKVVRPTADVVTVLGFDIDGRTAEIRPSARMVCDLVASTRHLLRQPIVRGHSLSQLIGSWTWCMMLRRPALAALQRAYHYIEVAGTKPFTLWPTVRRELITCLALLPLMRGRLDAPFFDRLVATDASEFGAGVVAAPLVEDLLTAVLPVCSSRGHAHGQVMLRTEPVRAVLDDPSALSTSPWSLLPHLASLYDRYYAMVDRTSFREIISQSWLWREHINLLEVRAVTLALHWLLTYPSVVDARVLLLTDSLVTLYSLWKGRSSSPGLLLALRKAQALTLAGGITLMLGWIPSERNPADEPSRRMAHDHHHARDDRARPDVSAIR